MGAWLDRVRALPGFVDDFELYPENARPGVGARSTSVRGVDDTPTIYEWAGGREAFARWLNAFYDLVEDDEELAALFGGEVSEEHREHVTTWWCEVMGGPAGRTPSIRAATSTCWPSTAGSRSRPSCG